MPLEDETTIPGPIKVFTWGLILFSVFVVYVYTYDPSVMFPLASVDSYSSRLGFATAGVRVIGSLVALVMSVVANNPRWLFITLVSRMVNDLGDSIVGLVMDGAWARTTVLMVLVAFELWATLRLAIGPVRLMEQKPPSANG